MSGSTVLGGLSSSRRSDILAVDPSAAFEELARRARRVEIACSNEILRILRELEELRELQAGRFRYSGTGLFQIVQPDRRGMSQEHVRDPAAGEIRPQTICGVPCRTWEVVADVPRSEIADYLTSPASCGRCVRSLRLTLGQDGLE